MRIVISVASLFLCGLSTQAGLYIGDTSQCEGAIYAHDEASNLFGPSRCATKCDCDGNRTCSLEGYCEGIARVLDDGEISWALDQEHVPAASHRE